jgi:membrane protein DedA with SNARE-associated domain
MEGLGMNIEILGQWADALLDAVDLKTVFLASLVEKFIPVLPSYILFPAIGAGATTSQDLVWRCLIAALGSIGGGIGWYAVGVAIGEHRVRSFVERYGRWLFLKTKLYDQMSASYRRNPFMITVLGQMMPTVRIFHALPAGVLRLPLGSFLLATALGALGWISALAGAGYILHLQGWSVSETGLGLFAALVATEVAVLLAVVLVRKIRAQPSGTNPAAAIAISRRRSVNLAQFLAKGR